ncbi:MAG: hypothetical protein EA425_10320 [Puniceicoccaceae bacterium]|nr:MAG: hypothetical protein EA425_10320 [Puniceicoccaceae bacterium]
MALLQQFIEQVRLYPAWLVIACAVIVLAGGLLLIMRLIKAAVILLLSTALVAGVLYGAWLIFLRV